MGTGRAVEVLHYRGPAAPDNARWTGGSGYLIGARLVLTAAHNVDYRQELGDDEQLLVRTIAGSLWATRVVLIGDEPSQVDLALLEISDPRFDQYLPPVSFARVNRDSPAPLSGCWAVGFPQFGEAGPVLPEGSHKETWQVLGEILPGTKLRAGLLSLQVTSKPSSAPLAGSEWAGMSGALVFATDPDDGQQAIAVVIMHHLPEGESALTLVPITAINGLSTAAHWWQQLGIGDPDALPVRPPPSAADQQRSRLTGKLALKEHWDPRGRGVEHGARPGWFFTGRRQALSQLMAWLTAAPTPADNVRVVTGGPGSGKSAVLARLVTMSDPEYRARMPRPLAPGNPVADLAPGAIDVAVHARTALAGEVVSALAYAAGAPQADLDGLIDRLLERREAFTIAVDALDEADDPPELAQKLRKLASETADSGVRLLVGTRPGGPDRRLITTLGLSARGDDPALVDLDDPRYLSREDLADYVRGRLLLTDIPPDPGWPDTPYRGREALAGQVAAAVASAAYPAFLVGQLVSRALVQRNQPLTPHDPGWQQFPKTVAGAMDQYLASVGDQNEQDRLEDLLRPLAYARGDGLPLDEDAGLWPRLATALAEPGRRYTVGDVAALLDTADYLVETVVTGQAAYYRLYHQALSDRIRERYEQHLRPVSAAQTVYQCLLDTVARRPDGAADWPTAHPYLLSQLAGHATDAGQLTGLLEDPGFLLHADLRRLIPLADHATLASEVVSSLSEAGRQRARLLRLTPRAITADPATRTAMFSVTETLENLGHTYTTSDFPAPYRAVWATATPQTERSLLEGHTDSVNAACSFTLNGRTLLASGGDDRVVRIWDPAAGAEHAVLQGHTGQVRAVCAFTQDDRPLLASGSDDLTVRIWDPAAGTEHTTLPGHTGGVIAVCAFTQDDRLLLASGSYDGTVRIWDPAAGAEHAVLRGHTGWVRAVCAFTQDDRVLLASGSADGTVRIWDPAAGTEHAVLPGHTGGVIAVCAFIQNDRPLLASGGDDGVVRIRDPATGTERTALQGHTGQVRAVCAFTQDDRPLLASGGEDGTVRIWDPATGAKHAPLRGHTGWVRAVCAFSEDDRVLLASGSADGTVRIWDPATGAKHAPPQGHTSRVRAVCAFTRDDRALLASGGDDGAVRIRDTATGAEHMTLPGHTGGVNAVCAFAQDDRALLASSGDDGTVRIWDPATGTEGAVLRGHTGWVRAVCAFTQDDRPLLASGSYDRTVRIWDPATGAKHAVLPGQTGQVRAVCAFTQDGRPLLASGGDDGMLRIRDPATGAEHAVLPGHTGWVNAVCAFTRDDRVLLASGSDDRTVRIWDPATGAKHAVLSGHTRGVNAVCAFTQDDCALLASGSDDRTVRIWDPMTTTALLTVPVHHPVWAVSYATDVLVVAVAAGLLAIQFNLAVGK